MTPRTRFPRHTPLVVAGLAAGVAVLLVSRGLQARAEPTPPTAAAGEKHAGPAEGVIHLEPETLRLASLKIEPASIGLLSSRLEVTGVVESDPSGVVKITPTVAGKVESVRVNLGDSVSAGAVLAEVSSNELATAQGEYHHCKHQLTFAEKHLERQRQLAKLGAFGRPRLEDARSRASATQGDVEVGKAEVHSARSKVAEARGEAAALRSEIAAADAEVAGAVGAVTEAQSGVSGLGAALVQARTAEAVARSKVDRYSQLLKEELISRQDWEQAQAELQNARSGVESAQANLSRGQAGVDAARSRVKAVQARLGAARERARQAESRVEAALAQQAQSEARVVASARAAAISTESLTREEAVFKGSYLTSKELVEAETARLEAEHELEAAETRVRLLGGVPGGGNRIRVRAPISGRVTERAVSLGEMVTPERALFTVVDLNSLWVQLSVYPQDLARLRLGQQVTLSADTAPGAVFTGSIEHLGSEVDPATRATHVRCVVRGAQGLLRPSVFVRGEVLTAKSDSRVVVPRDAIQDFEDQRVVFVPAGAEGEFRARPVIPGRTAGDRVEILHGLSPGERVVTGNAFLVKAQAFKAAAAEE